MCGILGYINKLERLDIDRFKTALSLIKHRGPDNQGVYSNGDLNLMLGHNRLSFLDLSDAAKQPMQNIKSDACITFNGEIYNYKELRSILESKGHQFNSQSDTEVILNGYAEWGISVVSKLEGMFAFGLLDISSNRLILARDPFGIKPLYYFNTGQSFGFASELKSLIYLDPALKSLDYTSFIDFFVYRYVPSPKTIWKDIRKIPPAEILEVNLETLEMSGKSYWEPNFTNNIVKEEALLNEINEILFSSTKIHLRADVPIGSFLSGGYDSSALVYYSSLNNYPLNTFSIGFEDWGRSEHQSADIVAKHFQVNNEFVIANNNDLNLIDRMPAIYDEPIADISIIPTYMVSQLASKHVKAVLSGEGADELFGGYHWQKEYFDIKHKSRLWGKMLSLFRRSNGVSFYSNAMSMGHFDQQNLRLLLQPKYHKYIPDDVNWFYRQHYKPSLGHLKSIQWMDVKCFMAELVLTKVDRASMANSLEVRVPFLNKRLFELIFSISEKQYFKPKYTKFALYKNIENALPKSILKRKKQGFVGPDKYYMNKEWYRKIFDKSKLVADHIINAEYIEQLLTKQYDWRLWKIAVMEIWYAHWN